MKHLNYIYIIILLVLVAACSKDDEGILDDGTHSQGEGQTSSSVLPGKELRGVWIATVWGLDWPMEKYNADVQKKLYTSNPQLSSSASFLRLNVLSSLN